MYRFKRNEIIVIRGAGASIEAGIPHSAEMIKKLECLISEDKSDWAKYRNTYNFVKSSIYYSGGIRGNFNNDVNYNIESLVNILKELKKRNNHPLFPFIGSWVPSLKEAVGQDFDLIEQFEKDIVKILRQDWISLDRFDNASYYKGLIKFQKEYQHPLRIFSLNYDMCVETVCRNNGNTVLERGFEDQEWDWRRFEETTDSNVNLYLYKLHGSTDWQYNDNNILTYLDNPSKIAEAAIIFGTTYKLQYLDPFLFLFYEFRKWSLEAKLIISIGYGFGDEHINGILRQALNQTGEKRVLLVIKPVNDEDDNKKKDVVEEKKKSIAEAIGICDPNSIHCWSYKAKEFFEKFMTIDQLANLTPFANETDLFNEIDIEGRSTQ